MMGAPVLLLLVSQTLALRSSWIMLTGVIGILGQPTEETCGGGSTAGKVLLQSQVSSHIVTEGPDEEELPAMGAVKDRDETETDVVGNGAPTLAQVGTNPSSTPLYRMKLPTKNETGLLETMSTENFCMQMVSSNEQVAPVDIDNEERRLFPVELSCADGNKYTGILLEGDEVIMPHSVLCCKGRTPGLHEIVEAKCQPQPPSLLQVPDQILKLTFDSTDEKTLAQAKNMVASLPPTSVVEVANADLVRLLQSATKAVVKNARFRWPRWLMYRRR